jgi:iron complex transport system substrate-binding protein
MRWLLIAVLFASCARPPSGQTGRVVCLVPSVTEIIYALGQEKQLAGNTTFCDYPEAAKLIPKVGDFSNPSVEKIIGMKPVLVFATLPEQSAVVAKLQKLGIKVVISRPTDIDSMFREIISFGRLLGAETRARLLVDSLRKVLAAIPVRALRSRVYVEISGQPLMSVGKGTFLNEAIERAGGANIFADVGKEYPVVTQEQVIARDPEVVIILHPQASRAEFLQRIGWQGVSAVGSERVFDDLNPDLVMRSGPRIVAGIEELARRFGE